MTFKSSWEKTDSHTQIDDLIIKEMVKTSLPDKIIQSFDIISGGCANLNIKLTLLNDLRPLILRIYLRDPSAAYREQKIATWVKQSIPVPKYYSVGEVSGYLFALVEFMAGMSLRDLLLNNPDSDMKTIMTEVGEKLAAIQSFKFDHSGFFDMNLKIGSPILAGGYRSFVKECLASSIVIQQLGEKRVANIDKFIEKYGPCFPDGSEAHLVHADFDPANILVTKKGSQWKISAILDWEFSFSGSWLCDVANMLRYAYQVHPDFEEFFLHGLTQNGLSLPPGWRRGINLLNLMSLLDCLVHCPPEKRPNQCADICRLIDHIIKYFEEQS